MAKSAMNGGLWGDIVLSFVWLIIYKDKSKYGPIITKLFVCHLVKSTYSKFLCNFFIMTIYVSTFIGHYEPIINQFLLWPHPHLHQSIVVGCQSTTPTSDCHSFTMLCKNLSLSYHEQNNSEIDGNTNISKSPRFHWLPVHNHKFENFDGPISFFYFERDCKETCIG